MLHCASTAKVVKPLAFDAGVLPDWGTGVGVAQIQGMVCDPSSTGPPRGWLVIVRLAKGRPLPRPLASASTRFSPSERPVSTPRRVRAAGSATNAASTFAPLSVSVTFSIGTSLGTFTSTSASPSLIRSARFDRVRISKLNGGNPGWAPRAWACADSTGAGVPLPQPVTTTASIATSRAITVECVCIFLSSSLRNAWVDVQSLVARRIHGARRCPVPPSWALQERTSRLYRLRPRALLRGC